MSKRENEILALLRTLQRHCPDQGVRARLVGVAQPTMSRWDNRIAEGKVPRMDQPSVIRLRNAVEYLEGKRPDFERGLRVGLGEIEAARDLLMAMLPHLDTGEAEGVADRGRDALGELPGETTDASGGGGS